MVVVIASLGFSSKPAPLPPKPSPLNKSASHQLAGAGHYLSWREQMMKDINSGKKPDPGLLTLLEAGGATFENYFVTTPICCPSRISLLSGRWAHNTGAMSGTPAGWCAVGKYWKAPMQNKSFPNWLRAAGVTTGLFGKEVA